MAREISTHKSPITRSLFGQARLAINRLDVGIIYRERVIFCQSGPHYPIECFTESFGAATVTSPGIKASRQRFSFYGWDYLTPSREGLREVGLSASMEFTPPLTLDPETDRLNFKGTT